MTVLRASLIAALATALLALGGFGLLHAWWITPIWSRLAGGLPFTVAGALAAGWAYAEWESRGGLPLPAALGGLVFGLGAWLALIPATLLEVGLRQAGMHNPEASWPTYAELLVTAAVGGGLGSLLHAGRQPVLACGLAAAVLLAVQAGPVPVTNDARAAGLAVLLAGVYAASGAVQAWLTARLKRGWRHRP